MPQLNWPSLKRVDIDLEPTAPGGIWYFTGLSGRETPPPFPEAYDRYVRGRLSRIDWIGEPTPYETGPPRPPSEAESVDWTDEYVSSMNPTRDYRFRPTSHMNSLLIAAAKAVRYMPALERFSIHHKALLHLLGAEGMEDRERCFSVTFATERFALYRHLEEDYRGEWYEGLGRREMSWMALPETWRPDIEVREEWARTLGEDGRVFYERGGLPTGKWLDTAEFLKGMQRIYRRRHLMRCGTAPTGAFHGSTREQRDTWVYQLTFDGFLF
ncbi:uncharacterized protein K452DRAFT_97643 [Aplosporella prunicola CBS 121167]|uniref:Uncharacterized protein n=1 Tax=Aplosporella prunicola CBS 121167 TaxID=1176127 RepID=A0A6A6B371_9PEZI|nr:uncharacterized protein K452DRAFT_97643 [Aplosporella prunicola CBS 121167]KAF2137705.1 hypothetical protein K452DRAFT_97643 [Aplosporella prunicola CBS 121167]